MSFPVGAFVVALTMIGAFSVHGHTGATGVVKQRMNLMKALAAATRSLKTNILAKGGPTTAERNLIAADAAVVEKHALKMLGMFPKSSNKHPSEALPSIWTDWSGFKKSAQALASGAARLMTLSATGNREALLGAFAGMARNCGGCHAQYRLKKR